jgi:hypothetical protein
LLKIVFITLVDTILNGKLNKKSNKLKKQTERSEKENNLEKSDSVLKALLNNKRSNIDLKLKRH